MFSRTRQNLRPLNCCRLADVWPVGFIFMPGIAFINLYYYNYYVCMFRDVKFESGG